uniref:Tetraspanin n=1 Tax=Peronospora matthiolae TaxID=2874970 RepID=A0AAV1TNU1_9STRA
MRQSRTNLRVLTVLSFSCGILMWIFALQVRRATNLRSSAAALVTLSSFVMLLSVLGFVGAKRDRKSRILLLFFGCNFLLVSSLFVMCYAAFFFQDALESWIKHHWAASALRDKPCCTTYSDTVQYLKRCAVIVGGLGTVCMLLVISAMYFVVRIVTVPVVMRRMQSVLNVVFMILGTGLFAVGLLCYAHDEMTSGQKWMAIILITVGALLFALSVLGIITLRARSRSLLLAYIIGLGGCLVALVLCSFSAFFYPDKLAWTFQEQKTSSKLACDLSLPGCTNCTELVFEMTRCEGAMRAFDNYWVACDSSTSGIKESATGGDCLRDMMILNDNPDQGYIGNDIAECGKCPEWSATDVRVYLQSLLHLLGIFVLVVCLFIAVGFAGALVLRRSLAGYQTDSV